MGEATIVFRGQKLCVVISIHASRGGSDISCQNICMKALISIHASRGGSDAASRALACVCAIFQSTLPVGEATGIIAPTSPVVVISIHASRGGSDGEAGTARRGPGHFNPRFPWGKRPSAVFKSAASVLFQSTLPVGEATSAPYASGSSRLISIHASRGGSDESRFSFGVPALHFNPRLPWGKRPAYRRKSGVDDETFQSTLPVGEATSTACWN